MSDYQFVGMLVFAIITLGTFLGLIIKPIINLNKSITKLNASIDRLNEENDNLSERVTRHGLEIDKNTKQLIVHDEEIKHIKEKIEK